MDESDYAVMAEERAWRELERRLAAHRSTYRLTCQDCGELLQLHRLAYGICVPCQAEAEMRAGWGV